VAAQSNWAGGWDAEERRKTLIINSTKTGVYLSDGVIAWICSLYYKKEVGNLLLRDRE
jgi:hypothetical protein